MKAKVAVVGTVIALALSLIGVNSTVAQADQIGASHPIVSGGLDIYAPTVIRSGSNWKMWFGGWETTADQPDDKIFYATSSDAGVTWTTPVLAFQISGIAVNDPSVIKVTDQATGADKYLMYFTRADYSTPDQKNLTGMATSSDGINWTDQGTVIGYNNGFDNNGAWAPSAIAADPYGNTVYLYYFTDNRTDPNGVGGFPNSSVLRSTMTNGGKTLSSTINVIPADGHTRVNVDVSVDPGTGLYWMFVNGIFHPTSGASYFDVEKLYSRDGLSWTPSRFNPVQVSSSRATATPHVVWTGPGQYTLLSGFGDNASDLTSFHRIMSNTYTVEPEEPATAVTASSTVNAYWPASNAIDTDASTSWSSVNVGGPSAAAQTLTADLGSVRSVHQLTLTPRTYAGVSTCFPTSFKIQTSTDGSNFTDVPGLTFTNYATPSTAPQVFNFGTTIDARYVRVSATGFSADPYGNYYFQIAEITPEFVSSNIDPIQSTDASSFAFDAVTSEQTADGNPSTFWSSAGLGSASGPAQYLSADLGVARPIAEVAIQPRVYQGAVWGFPSAFYIQTSLDDINWTTVPGQTYSNYVVTGTTAQLFEFATPVTGRAVRVVATGFTTDPYGTYVFQAADISVANH